MNGAMVLKTFKLFILGIDRSLLIGILCGCVCVLVDLDHPIAWAFGLENGRIFHPYYFLISCLVILGCGAYIGGLLFKAILRRGNA